jgi:hypothetical protein
VTIPELLSRLKSPRKQGDGWMALCPGHDDRSPSLRVTEGDGGRLLLKCFAGCEVDKIVQELGLEMSDLFAERSGSGNERTIATTYSYSDEAGALLFQVVRYSPKGFSQRRPDGKGGWIYNLEGVRRVLYRLPELQAADPGEWVFLPEGERDVERLRASGLVATCSPMGAGKWRDEYAKLLAGRKVVIIPDNDQPGRNHAQAEAKSLRGVATSVKMLNLSGLPEKGDVSDWLKLGGTVETLCSMAEAAPEWTPGADEAPKAERIAVSWGELCEMKLERRETILHEVERGEIIMCPAITNRGKTTFWRNVALSIACGREFDPIVKGGAPRSVLYMDFETRLYRARADITKMLGKLEQSQRALISNNLHLIADCRINGRPLTLSDPHHLGIVEAEAKRVNADVIVIDTLTAAFEVENENDNAEAARIMKKLTALALRLNCVIIFLHHVGKAKQEEGQTAQPVHRARGASAYAGFSHAIWGLLPQTSDPTLCILECAKVKGEKFVDRTMKLDPVTRWFANLGEAEKPKSAYEQVIGVFNGKPLKRADVQNLLPKIAKTTLTECLKKAIETGELINPSYGFYQKPDLPDLPDPIGSGNSGNSAQPDEDEEFSLDSLDWDETHDPATSDGDKSGYLEAIDQ